MEALSIYFAALVCVACSANLIMHGSEGEVGLGALSAAVYLGLVIAGFVFLKWWQPLVLGFLGASVADGAMRVAAPLIQRFRSAFFSAGILLSALAISAISRL